MSFKFLTSQGNFPKNWLQNLYNNYISKGALIDFCFYLFIQRILLSTACIFYINTFIYPWLYNLDI